MMVQFLASAFPLSLRMCSCSGMDSWRLSMSTAAIDRALDKHVATQFESLVVVLEHCLSGPVNDASNHVEVGFPHARLSFECRSEVPRTCFDPWRPDRKITPLTLGGTIRRVACLDSIHRRLSTTRSSNMSLRCFLYISQTASCSDGVAASERAILNRQHSLHIACCDGRLISKARALVHFFKTVKKAVFEAIPPDPT